MKIILSLVALLSFNTFAQSSYSLNDYLGQLSSGINELGEKLDKKQLDKRQYCFYMGELFSKSHFLGDGVNQHAKKRAAKRLVAKMSEKLDLARKCKNGISLWRVVFARRGDIYRKLKKSYKKLLKLKLKMLKDDLNLRVHTDAKDLSALIQYSISELPVLHSDDVGPVGVAWKPQLCYDLGYIHSQIAHLWKITEVNNTRNQHLEILLQESLETRDTICLGTRYTDKYRRQREKMLGAINMYISSSSFTE
jgi:hypothetical protein